MKIGLIILLVASILIPPIGAGNSCTLRYNIIKKILDTYQRPFTVLDIGAGDGSLSLRIASEYSNSTCVMIEGDRKFLLPQLCTLHKQLNNIIVLEKNIEPSDLVELASCEHFDLVIACNVIQNSKGHAKEIIDALLMLGDHIIIETPLLKEYLVHNKYGKALDCASDIYLFQMHKNILTKPTWGSPNLRFYAINSTFKEKTIYKPRINKTIPWKPGINLWTFKQMNGVYPKKEIIHDEIKRLSAFPHLDFLPWNMIIQGHTIELIDWDDNNAPHYMHNYQACLAQFESKDRYIF